MMLRLAPLALALLLVAPVASAGHWTEDNPNAWGTSCLANPLCVSSTICTGGAPPQVVDFALHCAIRAASNSPGVVSLLPGFAYALADDVTERAEDQFTVVSATTAGPLTPVNVVLCANVWSHFCANPVATPPHAPLDDPLTCYRPPPQPSWREFPVNVALDTVNSAFYVMCINIVIV